MRSILPAAFGRPEVLLGVGGTLWIVLTSIHSMRSHIESFLSGLSAIGYSPHSLVKRRAILLALERWVARRHLALQGLCEQHLEVFLRRRWRNRTHLSCARVVGLRFLEHLRTLGIVRSRPRRQKLAQFGRVLAAFDLYLREERGLALATRAGYVRHAAKFLHRDPKRRVGRISGAEVLGHVSEVLRLNSVPSANQASFALKSLLRFLFASGTLHADLSPAIPRILIARTARLPEVLSFDEVAQLLRRRSRTSVAVRNRAILFLLARLGVRGCEIMRMELDDIDWQSSTVLVRGKNYHHETMPLPRDAGAALVEYLRSHRPICASRRVFICLKAPHRPFSSTRAISSLVAKELERAAIKRPRGGAGLLRHSLATALLRRGATLPEIGSVLRHEHALTTRIYAKVDVEGLRGIARPWPVGARA